MSSPELEGLDAARARVHAQADASRRANQALRELASEVEAAVGHAQSAEGEIRVTAAVTGAVSAIQFSDAALEHSAADLARELIEVIAAAQRDAVLRAAAASAAQLGENHPLAAELRDSADRYGRPATRIE